MRLGVPLVSNDGIFDVVPGSSRSPDSSGSQSPAEPAKPLATAWRLDREKKVITTVRVTSNRLLT
jgi:hypothetical protein